MISCFAAVGAVSEWSSSDDKRGEVWERSGGRVEVFCAAKVKVGACARFVCDSVKVEDGRVCSGVSVCCRGECLVSLLRAGSSFAGGRHECLER